MEDVIVGLLAILVGALFCFRGYVAMRIIIPMWGAFVGFMLGAGLVAGVGDDAFLRSTVAWIVGIAAGLLFALLAYLYYEVSVAIAMGGIGFVLGTGLMVALGVDWSWLIVLIGVIGGTLLAIIAIAGDLPMVLLTVLAAMAGATTIVGGIMLLTGTIDTLDFETVATTKRLDDDWWWYAIYLGLVIAGIISQLGDPQRRRGSVRQAWQETGGRQFKAA
jgi:hypothetical protein